MGAYSSLVHAFGVPIEEYARRQGYHESNLMILRGDLEGLRSSYPQIYGNLMSCRHHSDRRTPLEYGRDLVASWLLEDHFLMLMNGSSRFTVRLSGNDSKRLILKDTGVSTTSDFLLEAGDRKIPIELMNDYTGFWARTQRLHLRDNKYQSLCRSKSLLLAASIPTMQYALFDFGSEIPAKYIPNHPPYGNKPAYELSLSSGIFKSLQRQTLLGDLNGLVPSAPEEEAAVDRLYDPNDNGVKALVDAYLKESGRAPLTNEKLEQLSRAIRDGSIVFFGAKQGSRIVGLCSVARCFCVCAEEGILGDFYVEPSFRNKGIDRKLAQAAQQWCRESGLSRLCVTCAPCDEALYQSLGFSVKLGTGLAYGI